jgi:hypothetical protein
MKSPTEKKHTTVPAPASKPFFSKKDDDGIFGQTEGVEQPFFAPDISRQAGTGGENKAQNLSFFQRRSQPIVQPQLTINEPGDKYEKEADAMAEQVMQKSASADGEDNPIQPQSLSLPTLMRKGAEGGGPVSRRLSSQLNSSQDSGAPLSSRNLASMNQAFGADFSSVRIHADSKAAEMSHGIQAKAFTHGSDIYFNHGQYSPEAREGQRLLGHELTHVVQQGAGNAPGGAVQRDPLPDPDADKSQELEETPLLPDEVIEVVVTAPPVIPDERKNPPVARPQWVFKQNKAYWAQYELFRISPLRDYDPIYTPKAYANRVYQAQKYLRSNNFQFQGKKIALDGILGPETILFLHYILQNEDFSAAHFELTGMGFDREALNSAAAAITARKAEVDKFPPKFLQEWKIETKAEAALNHIMDDGDLEKWYDWIIFGGTAPPNIQKQGLSLGDRHAILLKAYASTTFRGLAALVEVDRNFLDRKKDCTTLIKRHEPMANLFWIGFAADTQGKSDQHDSWFHFEYPNKKAQDIRATIGPKSRKNGQKSLIGLLSPFFIPKLTPEERLRLQLTTSEYLREKAENIDNYIIPKAEILLSLIRDQDTLRGIRANTAERELAGFFGRPDVFEKFVAYLISKGDFVELIEGVEQLRSVSVLEALVQLCMQTPYRDHPAVVRAHERLMKLKRDIRSHDYIAGEKEEQAVLLEKEPGNKLKVGEVAGGRYIISEDRQAMKPARQKALEDKMRELIMADIAEKMGKDDSDQEDLSEEKYMEKILEKAAAELKIGERDFEEVTYQEGYRLLGVKSVLVNGVEQFMVDYEKVNRTNGGKWETLEASSGFQLSRAFEESLGWFKFANQMKTVETLVGGMAIVVGGVVLLASGAGGALIALGGGAKFVGLSIAISVLIWAITAEHHTIEGFLHAVLDGYLMAVGFKLFTPIGRGVARLIGTATFKQKLVGLIMQSIVTGGGAGAFTGPASMLIKDALQGRLAQHSIGDYLRAAKTGFLLGAMFELGGSFILGPLLRTAGKNVLERILNIEQWKAFVQKSGIVLKPGEWASEITRAYSGCKNWLAHNMESSIENLIAKKIYEQAVALLESYTQGLLLTIHRQALDLIGAGMTKESVSTLEKIIFQSSKTMKLGEANALVDEILNKLAKNPTLRVNSFFSLVNVADQASFQAMLGKGMKELASADAILQLAHVHPPATVRSIWQYHFENNTTEFTAWIQKTSALTKETQQEIFRLLTERGGAISPALLLEIAQKRVPFSNDVLDGLVRLTDRAKGLDIPVSDVEKLLASLSDDQLERFLATMRDLPAKEFDALSQSMLRDPANAGKKVIVLNEPGAITPMASDAFDWFVTQPKVKAAMRSNAKLRKLIEENREAVYELMQHEPIRSHLAENPTIVQSLIKHPEARSLLKEVLGELKTKGASQVVQELRTMPKLKSSLSPAQKNLSETFASEVKTRHPDKPSQEGFDRAQKDNPAYREQYMNDLYIKAREAAKELESKVNELAVKTDGTRSMRKDEAGQLSVKGRERADQKVRDDYGNDASKLVDIAGGKIVYKSFDELYRALKIIKEELGDKVVMFKDRFASPLGSGYQDILMNVKMSNGHIAEFRMHLKAFDIAAESEHALYEVSRVVAPEAAAKAGLLTLEQEAIMLLIRKKTNELYAKVVGELMTP